VTVIGVERPEVNRGGLRVLAGELDARTNSQERLNNAKRMIVDPKDPKRIYGDLRDAEGTTKY